MSAAESCARLCAICGLGGCGSGLLGADGVLPRDVRHLRHRGYDLVGRRSLLLGRDRDLLRRSRGLVDHPGDALEGLDDVARELGPGVDLLAAVLGGEDGRVGLGLDLRDDRLDLAGRLLRPLGELAHLGRDDREASAVLARTCGLDGGVERQQVGLVGEVVDHLEDAADLLALLAERQGPGRDRVHAVGDLVHRVHGARDGLPALLGVPERLGGVAGDGLGRVGDLGRGGGELLDGRGGLGDGRRLLGGAGDPGIGRRLTGAIPRRSVARGNLRR